MAVYDAAQGLMSHRLHSQTAMHEAYGGVVPELASRDHVRRLLPLVRGALEAAGCVAGDIDGVAYTAGPGLIGALLVGVSFARSLGYAWRRPTVAIHHLEGHLLAPLLEADPPAFPFLALLVSGGHTQLIDVRGLGRYRILGETLDDAAGEAFDKTAKMLGLPYPGGRRPRAAGRTGPQRTLSFSSPDARSSRARFQFQWLEDRRPSSLAGPCAGRAVARRLGSRLPGRGRRDAGGEVAAGARGERHVRASWSRAAWERTCACESVSRPLPEMPVRGFISRVRSSARTTER